MADQALEDHPDPTLWSGPGDQVLQVSLADYRRLLEAGFQNRTPIMVPARNDAGELEGYLALTVGVIPKDVAEAPGFDLSETVAEARRGAPSAPGALDQK